MGPGQVGALGRCPSCPGPGPGLGCTHEGKKYGLLKNLHNISENINGISTNFDEISVIFHQKKPSSPFDIVNFSLKFLLKKTFMVDICINF